LGVDLPGLLDALAVTFTAAGPATLLVYGDDQETAGWQVRGLSPAAG
jgi:hypothetical protein